jgi:preprotein translocase subunit SecY
MFSAFLNSLKIPELRARILFTFGLVLVSRVISSIPAPGVDAAALSSLLAQGAGDLASGLRGMLNMFSGGALERFAVGALGIMPYISASIIIQLLTAVVPTLEKLAREGDTGRQKITQITRYFTILLCLIQGWLLAASLDRMQGGEDVLLSHGFWAKVLLIVVFTAGTMVMMWLGEQITDRGIGNGISIIITVNIISQLPLAIRMMAALFTAPGGGGVSTSLFKVVSLIIIFFLVTAATVAVTQAVRKIPVQYAKRVVGRKVYGGQSTFLPLRLNYSGVMPIIFAQAILMVPPVLLGLFGADRVAQDWFGYMTTPYIVFYALMILFFSYFWVATQFNPVDIADGLKRNGGYVPGVRPGKPTADFLNNTIVRLTLAGAIFLTFIAIFPSLLGKKFHIDPTVYSFFGGSSLLIMVGVMLDTMRQIESHLLTRHYDGFLTKGRLRGRGGN